MAFSRLSSPAVECRNGRWIYKISASVMLGFEMKKFWQSLDHILLVRQFKTDGKHVPRYKTILVTLEEAGQVEPLVVYPQKDSPGRYLLLDGHLRHSVMKELGQTSVDCNRR